MKQNDRQNNDNILIYANVWLIIMKTWSYISGYNNRNITDISLSNNNKYKPMSYTTFIYQCYLCDKHIKNLYHILHHVINTSRLTNFKVINQHNILYKLQILPK
eukprot:358791_1